MLLTEARRPARIDRAGMPVLLADQDRTLWDQELVAEGHELVRRCLRWNQPGPYQIQAAIAAVHADAASAASTDWSQIVTLYDQLLAIAPSDIVRLNRAVAVAERDGADAGLALIEPLDLAGYGPWQVSRAELLRRIGRDRQAAAAYVQALELTTNDAERAHLQRRLQSLG
jgi:RNA polymerase sigma-70 factor (ECF subfamily)